jgi:hypothetical protein
MRDMVIELDRSVDIDQEKEAFSDTMISYIRDGRVNRLEDYFAQPGLFQTENFHVDTYYQHPAFQSIFESFHKKISGNKQDIVRGLGFTMFQREDGNYAWRFTTTEGKGGIEFVTAPTTSRESISPVLGMRVLPPMQRRI